MAALIVSESSFALSLAHSFLRDCCDERPESFGLEALSAEMTQRDGVYRQSTSAFEVPGIQSEDAMIALLDGGESDEVEEMPEAREPLEIDPDNDALVYLHGRLVVVEDGPVVAPEVSPESAQSSHPEAWLATGMGRSQARLHHRSRIVRAA